MNERERIDRLRAKAGRRDVRISLALARLKEAEAVERRQHANEAGSPSTPDREPAENMTTAGERPARRS